MFLCTLCILWRLKENKIFDKNGRFEKYESSVRYEPEDPPKYNIQNDRPIEVKKGSIVMFDGSFVHYSNHNHSDIRRHAFTMHIVESSSEWDKSNWLQRTHDLPFRQMYKEESY